MEDEQCTLTIREWQEQYRTGGFEDDDLDTMEKAGWDDWSDKSDPELKALSKLVMGVTSPFILDNYSVWFKHNTPGVGPMYGDVRFIPLDDERSDLYFLVALNSPHERTKWALISERNGYGAPEFECSDIRQMAKYINKLGPELESGERPAFLDEKDAVMVYALCQGEPLGLYVYREGEHRYSYTSFLDRKVRMLYVASSPETVPADFRAEHMDQIKNLFVFCRHEAAAPEHHLSKKAAKKKGVER